MPARQPLRQPLRQEGMVALETALGLPVLMLAIFLWCEMCFVGYVSAILDYTITESARHLRAYPHDHYHQAFHRIINNDQSFWRHFIDTERLVLESWYQADMDMLYESHCRENTGTLCYTQEQKGSLIAVYQVEYRYRPLFHIFRLGRIETPVLRREVIAVQEYERGS
ncbi:TadE family protein [Parendozoicomonas haliclonae]|uniref:TadE-like protein n=1 Tax=Parendozoicomonas haliclonae TaxID=1960125 RepID=A0A1X7AKR2_9GAMM|nr:TadE family protein [Parendozoicomonas haliclonae]SMA47550.1 TadE-like protein [Parendozoicomonas haliclonae]